MPTTSNPRSAKSAAVKPCSGSEIGAKRADAPFPAAPRKLFVECSLGLPGQVLVVGPGIHIEPFAVAVAFEPGMGITNPLRRDYGITDEARRERDLEVQPVAGKAAVEHEAGVGDRRQRLGLGCHRCLRQPPPAAIVDVEADLDIERGGDEALRSAHFGKRIGFIDRQTPSAREVDQKQIVLHQIAPETGLGQIAARQQKDKLVTGIGPPRLA